MSVLKRLARLRDGPQPQRLAPLRPAEVSKVGAEFSERPDLGRRRAFLAEHILIQTHIPKTGGTSIYDGLAAIVGAVHALDVRWTMSVPFDELTDADLADIHLLSGHFGFGPHERIGRKPLYIAAVREPVERAVSMYRYLQNKPKQEEAQHAIGRSFEAYWHEVDRLRAPARRDMQSRLLLGHADNSALDWTDLRHRIEQDYFLVIPQPEVSQALRLIRNAFGVPWTQSPRSNRSKSDPVTPSEEIRQTILEANPMDARLYAYVAETFDQRMDRAVRYIASHCLQPLEGTGLRTDSDT